MKAAVLRNIKEPLAIESDYPDPVVGEGEVVVQIKAAALNRRDLWIQQGQYARIKTPCILGSDGSGIVVEVGPNVSKEWIGKEVVINPSFNWGENPRYQSRQYEILGMPRNGTFAEYCLVPESQIVLKPENFYFEEAAALPLAGLTAYRALFTRGEFNPTEPLFINGIGSGVALFVFEFALHFGTEIWVSSSSEEKREFALNMGASGAIDYRDPEAFEMLAKQGTLFPLIIDSGGGETFKHIAKIVSYGGRIVFFGATTGAWQAVPAPLLFWKQVDLRGTTMGTRQEFFQMIRFCSKMNIKPFIHEIYTLDQINEALGVMKANQHMGKLVISFEKGF
jgi:NADPH:quinone reductase-like Zn-dependent oxidoreductase